MGEFGPEIETQALRRSDVPDVDPDLDDAWRRFSRFALTYDGYAKLGDHCAQLANQWARTYRESASVPDNADEVRACLFYEQRRWRHFERSPDAAAWTYLTDLLSRLRSCLPE